MAKYRKRPIVIEATQWTLTRYGDAPLEEWPKGVFLDSFGQPYVITIHNQGAFLDDGDWIITGPDGEHHYPCKPDIFEKTYEAVES
jgi:hypothetical protein